MGSIEPTCQSLSLRLGFFQPLLPLRLQYLVVGFFAADKLLLEKLEALLGLGGVQPAVSLNLGARLECEKQ